RHMPFDGASAKDVRPGADRRVFDGIHARPGQVVFVAVLGEDPGVEVDQRLGDFANEGGLHGQQVQHFYRADGVVRPPDLFGGDAFDVFVGEHHIFGGERLALVPADVGTEREDDGA